MTGKIALLGLGILAIFIFGNFYFQLSGGTSRTQTARLDPYGEISIHLETEPDPPKTGGIPLTLHITDQNGKGIEVDQVQYEYAFQDREIKPLKAAFETQSSAGGSVTVDVKPTTLMVGEPVVFDVAMNTHSVDLSDDMTKISTLRDDAGREYKPTAWDGPGGGGHHREGSIKFAALTSKPKYIELVIKGLAQVPERVFKWDLP